MVSNKWVGQTELGLVIVSLAVLLGGCPSGANNRAVSCTPGQALSCYCPSGASGMQQCAADGQSYGVCQCGGAAGSGGGGDVQGAPLPCDVSKVLQAKCFTCHGAMLNYTAPMHLTTADAFHAPAPSDHNVTVAQQAKKRLHNMQAPMPPATMPQLTPQELATLDAWLDGGAVAGTSAECGQPAADGGIVATGGTGGMNVDAGVAVDAGPPDPGEQCYDLVSHAPGSKDPYNVTNGTKDLYYCTTFPAPWQQAVHGISFKSKVQNTQIVHHWLLYQNITQQSEGASPCSGAHPDAALVAGWAVGGSDTILPADVGMQMGTTGYTLEVHYNNATGADIKDASGVQVCTTTKLRPHVAAVHWLGTTALGLAGAGDVNSTCTPDYSKGPITILSSWPHMHKHGVHMKSVINRAGGTQDMLIDKAFDFNYQVSYPMTPQIVLNKGDTIATTCSYGSGPVQFGEGTDQEMCFNFVLAWPAGSLQSLGAVFTADQCFN